ncbi:MAG: hypothetical protein HQL99_11520 [Magnetococcales bacterium]|nr:hypothetical protein [Magnetococcales bacterium]
MKKKKGSGGFFPQGFDFFSFDFVFGALALFFAKGAKKSFFEKRAKGKSRKSKSKDKSKTLGEESPRPPLLFQWFCWIRCYWTDNWSIVATTVSLL